MKFDQQIFNKAISMGIKPIQAKLIVAQARAETGNYLSPVFKNLNNAFGYKYIGQKKMANRQRKCRTWYEWRFR